MNGLVNQKVFSDVPSWVLNGGSGSGKPVVKVTNNVIFEGHRNDTLFRFACSLRAKDTSFDTALSALEAENQKRCNPPLCDRELRGLVDSAYGRYEAGTIQTRDFNCTDLGNAKRLVAHNGDKIRYCFAWKKWLVWDGKTWHIDNNGQILRLAKDTVKRIYGEALLADDDDQRETIAKWAIKSEEEKRLKSKVSLAQSEPGVPISPHQLDAYHYLLNCLNGTIDLKTGDLKQHNPQVFITKIIPVEYIPGATCPKWIDYLETIFNWNYDLIPYVQRAVGYSLTGDISEQCLFLLHGTGANGKSVFLKTMSHLLSDYAQTADFETFLIKKNDGGVRNDIARMQGKRFISAIEAESGKRLSENLIKSLTGGDTVSARFLFAEFFDFQPIFKLWLAANHKPNIRGTDYAIWRRIRLIPFNVTIPEEEQDKHLEEKLKAELPGILAWAVQGCLEWQRNGLQTPVEVKTATKGYRDEMDTIGAFISDCCVLVQDAKVQAGKLYGAYKKWCEENGEFTLTQRYFGMRLSEKGYERIESNGHWRKGTGLRENSTLQYP
ncbi:MAG: primase C-terminal domain-containing protein [Planctomycetia bacterium]|nr:primase C-terminal domain-containing protein [Planctomycetia bacterium]